MTVRVYLRRSKNDEGKQQYSLDVQEGGSRDWLRSSPFASAKVVLYVDDGKASDEFLSRPELRRLLADAVAGDVIVCRDQSRLGRDAIEVTLVIRDLVRDRGCRLFYYVSGQEVAFANAIDQATTFIQGTGHQMELEAIRSRVREALRMRARSGRIAGGRCFGYRLERVADGPGRSYTVAVIDEAQAEIVRRIFAWRCEGWGLKKITHELNTEGAPAPRAGRRGTGSWSPSCVRAMLQNQRYRGVYVHGKIKKVRRAGIVSRVAAEPTEVITVDLPEWRIVDDETWTRAQERFEVGTQPRRASAPAAKYPLTGIARCAACRGSVGVANCRAQRRTVKAYTCIHHHTRGASVCPVTIYQPIEEVEGALVAYVADHVLTPTVIEGMTGEIRAAIEAQLPKRATDVSELERELRNVKAEQKRLTQAVALADDVPELVTELRQRATRARALEVQIATAKRAPAEMRALVDQAEATVRGRLADVRAALIDRADLRAVFLRLFPDGIEFRAVRVGDRQVWRLEGGAALGRAAISEADAWFNLGENPSPSDEGSASNRDNDGTANKIAGMNPAALNTKPSEQAWFKLDRDPNGI